MGARLCLPTLATIQSHQRSFPFLSLIERRMPLARCVDLTEDREAILRVIHASPTRTEAEIVDLLTAEIAAATGEAQDTAATATRLTAELLRCVSQKVDTQGAYRLSR